MSSLAKFDGRWEQVIGELTLRLLVPGWSEFDAVYEAANGICDRYEITKIAGDQNSADLICGQESLVSTRESSASLKEPCAAHAPAQTPPPMPA